MLRHFNLKEIIPDLVDSIRCLWDTYGFVKKYTLWRGMREHKWVFVFTIVVSVLFTYTYIDNFIHYFFGDSQPSSDMASMGLVENPITKEAAEAGKKTAFSGGSKFLLLILMEVVIFFFSIQTIEKLSGQKRKPKFKDFVNAEMRMLKVMAFNFGKSLLVQLFLLIVMGILGMEFLSTSLMFLVHAYFLGYGLLDNYLEQYRKNIKESQLVIREHVGAALGLGMFTSLALWIPFFGAVLTPMYGAVAANIYGHRHISLQVSS